MRRSETLGQISDPVLGRVIFGASRRQVAELDVRLGPCAAKVQGGTRLASLWRQTLDSVTSVEALCSVLVPAAPSPWAATSVQPPGVLYTCADEFVGALVALQQASIQPDPDHPSLAPYRAAASRWQVSTPWPGGGAVDALVGRLIGDVEEAVHARRRKRGLYCWFGPLVLDETEDGLTGRRILEMKAR